MPSRRVIILSMLFLLRSPILAQEQLGKEWFLGLTGQILKFDSLIPYSKLLVPINVDTILIGKSNSNICDSDGNLILATDGIKLYDSLGKFIVGGGENINNDSIAFEYGHESAVANTSIILPKANNQYYIFISTMSDKKCNNFFHQWSNDTFDFDEIRYSIVDMNANGGKGKITVHNKLLLHLDENPWLNKSNFTACRHANGRDWWMLKPSARMRQVLYKFLVTPDSIYTYKENRPLLFNKWAYDNRGQSAFSKDGSLYAECNQYGPHTLYNFDRCSGDLTLKRLIDLQPFQDTFGNSVSFGPTWTGLCFSPNGRFLYTSDFFNVYQIDLTQSNDSMAIRRVSKDTNSNPLPYGHANYETMQLTPTNVIFLGHRHGISPSVNGILYPDKYGDSCGFIFDYFISKLNDTIDISNVVNAPNLPFYALGTLKGSPCDTLNPPPPFPVYTNIKVYPNPVSDNLFIELPSSSKRCEIIVFNMLGEMVYRKKQEELTQYKFSISLGYLSKGMYTLKIVTDREEYRGKVVKE